MLKKLENAHIWKDGAFADEPLYMENGRIVLPPAENAPAESVDMGGAYLLPGLIDIHTHGCFGVDVNAADREGYEKISRFAASQGTAGFLCSILTDTVEQTERCIRIAVDAIERPLPGARLLGIHLEGPFLSPQFKGAMPEHLLRQGDAGLFRRYQELARGHVLYMTAAPEVPGVLPMIREIAGEVTIAIGHSAATYDEACAAIQAGAKAATHTFNAMRPFHHHEPGIIGAVLESDIYCEAITDGLHLNPATLRLLLKVKGWDRVAAITDSIMAAGLPGGQYKLGVNDVTVKNGDARLTHGDARAGSTLTQARSVKNLLAFTGKPLETIAGLLTKNPAALLGLSGQGSLAPGSFADITAVTREGDILATIVRGETVYTRKD